MRAWIRFCAAGLAAVGVASTALAADEALVLRQSAERLAAADRCEEAMVKAKRARTLDPDDALAAAIEGRCALHLKRYDAAIDPLQRARVLDPSMPGLTIDLAMAHYHRGDLAAADRELSAAERQTPDDPRVLLYRGMLLMDRSQNEAAAAKFERAAAVDPQIDPLASYYASLAWQRARDRQRARQALEGVTRRAPDSPWADEARRRLQELDQATGFEPGRWSASASTGIEWDDNVVLRGDDVTLPNAGTPSRISNQRDWSVWWGAEARAELLRTENWAGGAIGGYYGDAHFDLHSFDQQTPTASLWLDRRVDDQSFVRLQPFFGYTWTEGDPYLLTVGGTLSYNRSFDEAGAGTLYATYAYRNYLFPISSTGDPPGGIDFTKKRDRDGTDFRVGYDHAIDVTDSTTLRAGVHYGSYEADGNEYSKQSVGGRLGLYQRLPWKLGFDADAYYAYEPYRRESSFPAPFANSAKRRDGYFNLRLQLDRPITDWLSVAAYYRYTDNDSNTPVFDYDRNIIGGYLTVHYGPQ
jgi:tetratricopeptide (TPR) repeat protein